MSTKSKIQKVRRGKAVLRVDLDVDDALLRGVESEIGPVVERSELESFLLSGFDREIVHPLVQIGEQALRDEEAAKARADLEAEEARIEKMRRELEEREARLKAKRSEDSGPAGA